MVEVPVSCLSAGSAELCEPDYQPVEMKPNRKREEEWVSLWREVK